MVADEPWTAGLVVVVVVVVERGVPSNTSLSVLDVSFRISKLAGGGAS